jgi:LmbE family N-acetylglucosaminyl deacetylase
MTDSEQSSQKPVGSSNVPRRQFLQGSAVTAGAILAGRLAPGTEPHAAETTPDAKGAERKKVFLAVGAHMDDAEIGAGGVLIQAARAGHRVVIVTVVSDYKTWLPTVGREEQTKRDLTALAQRFGFEKRFLDYPYHQIHGGDLELKRKLAEIYVELKPDVAFIHHHEDHWPDHVASGQASHDAFLFAHGLSRDLAIQRCPLIYAYDVSAAQTYHFEPDVYYDITPVMPAYMDLLAGTDSCLSGRPVPEVIQYEFRAVGSAPQALSLSGHGLSRFADCVRFGQRANCRFALGFRTVWGQRRGARLF